MSPAETEMVTNALKRMPNMVIRGTAVVRDAQGRIKLDPGFDVSTLSAGVRQELELQKDTSP